MRLVHSVAVPTQQTDCLFDILTPLAGSLAGVGRRSLIQRVTMRLQPGQDGRQPLAADTFGLLQPAMAERRDLFRRELGATEYLAQGVALEGRQARRRGPELMACRCCGRRTTFVPRHVQYRHRGVVHDEPWSHTLPPALAGSESSPQPARRGRAAWSNARRSAAGVGSDARSASSAAIGSELGRKVAWLIGDSRASMALGEMLVCHCRKDWRRGERRIIDIDMTICRSGAGRHRHFRL